MSCFFFFYVVGVLLGFDSKVAVPLISCPHEGAFLVRKCFAFSGENTLTLERTFPHKKKKKKQTLKRCLQQNEPSKELIKN